MEEIKSEIIFLSYDKILEEIQDKENHLLLGNGFNYGLGVDTSYQSIFEKMIKNQCLYKDAENLFDESKHDLECFIEKLTDDTNQENNFLSKFINNKVKLDFMQATHEIAKSKIKNVYAEKNEGIYLLLKNFTNYFTLNYDPFLYLLLLNFKSSDPLEETSIAIQTSLKFTEEDLNANQNNIFREINEARSNGSISLNIGKNNFTTNKPLKRLTKTHFVQEISLYSKEKNKGWSSKDINKVINRILNEEKRINILKKVDDGCIKTLFGEVAKYEFEINSTTQNLFFLHGAFHIYKDGQSIRKIVQETDKALYQRLEEILNDDERDIVCIFQSNDKETAIIENPYLRNCLNKLSTLSGNMVIIGSSLADNDNHIFKQINNSDIHTIYISAFEKEKEKVIEIAKSKFPYKEIKIFDTKTISYKSPEKIGKE